MEERGNKKNQVLLTVLGVATLLVAVIGATFAYFSASTVGGNSGADAIQATTAAYGAGTVTFEGGNNTLRVGTVDLPAAENGTDYKYLLKFTYTTTATTTQNISIDWFGLGTGSTVTNSFCRYAATQNATQCATDGMTGTCDGTPAANSTGCAGTWTAYVDVTNDVTYKLYSCTSAGYAGTSGNLAAKTTTIDAGCTEVTGGASGAIPANATSPRLHTSSSINVAAGSTTYYALELVIHNQTTTQDYNQGKTFEGGIKVSALSN